MTRTLLIARREFLAYARTVGFWLSLLAFPVFAVIGGAVPLLTRDAEPVNAVAVIEDTGAGAAGASLSVALARAFDAEQTRREVAALRNAALAEAGETGAEQVRAVAEADGPAAGREALARAAPRAASGFEPPRRSIVLVEPPQALSAAGANDRDAVIRRYLVDKTPVDGLPLSAVVILGRSDGAPSARVWSARAADERVEDAVRDALKVVNRQEVLARAGIDPAVVTSTETFRADVTAFSPNAASGGEVSLRDRLPGVIGLVFGFTLWSLILTGASILLNSVMEEKSNRILEVLLSSASATEILAGKVLGVALLTLTVMLVWGGLGAAALVGFAPDAAADALAVVSRNGLIVWFLLYMVGGYLMYAVLFAAIGAFCDTPRDAQTLMGPIMMVLIVPLLVMQMALQTPDAPAIRILSWIPLFTPFLMSARVPSEPPMIEIIGTMLGMFAFAALMVWVAGRAFRAGALSDVKLNWRSFAAAVRGK